MNKITVFRFSFYPIAGITLLFLAYSFGASHGFVKGSLLTQASFTEIFTSTTMTHLELLDSGELESLRSNLNNSLDLGLIILLNRQDVQPPWLARLTYYSQDDQLKSKVNFTLVRGATYRSTNLGSLIRPNTQDYKDLIIFVPKDSTVNVD